MNEMSSNLIIDALLFHLMQSYCEHFQLESLGEWG